MKIMLPVSPFAAVGMGSTVIAEMTMSEGQNYGDMAAYPMD